MIAGATPSAIVGRQLDDISLAQDARINALLALIHERHGAAVQAVLLYGSYVRGKRDTVLDFYVLLDSYRSAFPRRWHGWANRLLPPNVYHIQAQSAGGPVLAKYATARLDRFEAAVSGDFHSYFWARFAQPCVLVFSRNDAVRARVTAAVVTATKTFITRTLPMLPAQFAIRDLWRTGFSLTYRCELRAEKTGYAQALYDAYGTYLEELTAALVDQGALRVERIGSSGYRSRLSATERFRSRLAWTLRRWQGKPLSFARLVKAVATFNDPVDYVLWKIERHSGVHVEATEQQRRYPLIFGWGLLWRIYRSGGFR
jgi:hypothetical protein